MSGGGVYDHIRNLVDRFVQEGLIALAPDLYHGKVTSRTDEAEMNALDWPASMHILQRAVSFLNHPRSNGNIGLTGFCMGGALSFAAACQVHDLSAFVPFYGIPPASEANYAKVHAPLAHFAKHDEWATVQAASQIQNQLKAEHKEITLHVYDAQHAFMNNTRPDVYEPSSAKLAWKRTIDFFRLA